MKMFAVGDVVQLNSGGPLMTVVEIFETNGKMTSVEVNFSA